ncbi:hypothetical protein NKI12_28030 [Mesorhizobium australicum]|uniref:Uncharacterized protein n=1 Tax=Mesorhizobium australicum TaxID=536018 RepID=A0ACC6T710_9HYPH
MRGAQREEDRPQLRFRTQEVDDLEAGWLSAINTILSNKNATGILNQDEEERLQNVHGLDKDPMFRAIAQSAQQVVFRLTLSYFGGNLIQARHEPI